MNSDKRLSLRAKISFNVVIAIVGILAISAIFLNSFYNAISRDREIQIQRLVETTYGILDAYGQQETLGKMSREEAQQTALLALEKLHYGDDGYFWINDMDYTMIMHPTKPSLNGKYVGDTKDPTGFLLFQAINKAAKKSPQGGLVSYQWPKAGSDTPQPKISFVRAYDPWGWVIGSGIYVDDVRSTFVSLAMRMMSGVAIVALLMIGLSAWIGRSILTPINSLVRTMTIVERESDMTVRSDVTYACELGRIGTSFNHMMEMIHSIILEISAAVKNIKRDAQNLTDIADRTRISMNEEQSQTTQAATAMDEMSATVTEIASGAGNTADLTKEASMLSKDGYETVSVTVNTVNVLADNVRKAAKTINQLDKDAETIGGVLKVIEDIAEQTNLLALNAAIEAARAGESGRGFAVVADEVRNLASRTQNSTQEIQSIIQTVQMGARNAVGAMDESHDDAEKCVGQARTAGESLTKILESVARIEETSTQIATAAEEQSAVANEITKSIHTINSLSQQNAESADQTAQSGFSLKSVAEKLNHTIVKMKID